MSQTPKPRCASLAQFSSLLTLPNPLAPSLGCCRCCRCCCRCSVSQHQPFSYPEYEVEKNQDGFGGRDSALPHVHCTHRVSCTVSTATARTKRSAPAAFAVMVIKWLRWSSPTVRILPGSTNQIVTRRSHARITWLSKTNRLMENDETLRSAKSR